MISLEYQLGMSDYTISAFTLQLLPHSILVRVGWLKEAEIDCKSVTHDWRTGGQIIDRLSNRVRFYTKVQVSKQFGFLRLPKKFEKHNK